MTTLYEKLGGAPAIDAAVDIFYDKVLADERIKHFFVNTDMAKQRQHQKNFLTYAFGGSGTSQATAPNNICEMANSSMSSAPLTKAGMFSASRICATSLAIAGFDRCLTVTRSVWAPLIA